MQTPERGAVVPPRADEAAQAPFTPPSGLSRPANGSSPIGPADPRPEGNIHRVPQPGNPFGGRPAT